MAVGNRTVDFRLEGIRFANYNTTIDSGVALTSAARATFLATEAAVVIEDNDLGSVIVGPGGETGQKQIYLDQIWLKVIGAGTGLTNLEIAIFMDNTLRRTTGGSGGTNINANSFNTDMRDSKGTATGSIANVFIGPVTTGAAVQARPIGRAVLDNAAPVVNETYYIDFAGMNGIPSVQSARSSEWPMPLATIGPGQSFIIYIWGAGMTAAPTFEYGLIWLED